MSFEVRKKIAYFYVMITNWVNWSLKKKKTFITQKISFEGKKKFLISKNKQSKDMVILKQVKWTYQWRLEMELLWWQKIYPRQFQWDLFSIFMKVFFQNFWRLFYNYFVIPTATSLNILWGKKGCFDFKMVFFFFLVNPLYLVNK